MLALRTKPTVRTQAATRLAPARPSRVRGVKPTVRGRAHARVAPARDAAKFPPLPPPSAAPAARNTPPLASRLPQRQATAGAALRPPGRAQRDIALSRRHPGVSSSSRRAPPTYAPPHSLTPSCHALPPPHLPHALPPSLPPAKLPCLNTHQTPAPQAFMGEAMNNIAASFVKIFSPPKDDVSTLLPHCASAAPLCWPVRLCARAPAPATRFVARLRACAARRCLSLRLPAAH